MKSTHRTRVTLFAVALALAASASSPRFSVQPDRAERALSSKTVRAVTTDFVENESEDDLPLPGFEKQDPFRKRKAAQAKAQAEHEQKDSI